MKQDTSKYQYQQRVDFKEKLELEHLKQKTIFVNVIVFIMSLVVIYFLFRINSPFRDYVTVLLMFVITLFINITLYSYKEDHFSNLKLAMYFNTISIYVISIVLIFKYETPSVFTTLFIAYAITAIYQDYKSMILSNITLFITGALLVGRFPSIFAISGADNSKILYILVFLSVFVLLLTISSYILIKRKTFFYNQLAEIKESEIRNIRMAIELQERATNKSFDSEAYYEALNEFSKKLSKEIGIENIFERRLSLLKNLSEKSLQTLLDEYPEFSLEDIIQLRKMDIKSNDLMRRIGVKASQSFNLELDKNEIFSENQFKTMKHYGDSKYTKIIAFVIFYCLLKLDKEYLREFDDETIKDALYNSEFFYKIDRDVIELYLENNDVFDTVVEEILKEGNK